MTLTVCGSSSAGNSYALQSDTETLLIEAGIRLSSVKKVLNYDLKKVVGCITSHVHQDHFKYAKEYSRFYKVCAPELNDSGAAGLLEGRTYNFGSFRVTPFEVYHDVKCFGYLIYHHDMGTLLFATDTFALPYAFKNVNHWMIEANYSDEILNENVSKGIVDNIQRKRIITSHMSLGNTIVNLRDGKAGEANTIVLIHLSSRNSDAEEFKNIVQQEFGTPTFIAKKGLKVNLAKV